MSFTDLNSTDFKVADFNASNINASDSDSDTFFVNHVKVPSLPLNFVVYLTVALASLIALYFWFIFSYGPKFMKNRQPYNLLNIIRGYNIFQLIACSVFVIQSYMFGFDFRFLWRCQSFEFLTQAEQDMVNLGTWFFLGLRILEFIETVFFILRKKKNQASFLHIYHHISTVLLMYVYLVFDTELMAIYNASINSFVHVVMYFYYFLSSFKSTRECINIFKPVITIIQLAQFVMIMGHCIIAVWPGCHAGVFFYCQIANLTMLTVLFSHFFFQNYVKNKK